MSFKERVERVPSEERKFSMTDSKKLDSANNSKWFHDKYVVEDEDR